MSDYRTVLLVAAKTGYQTEQFRAAAARIGVEVTLAIDRCTHVDNTWGPEAIAVEFDKAEDAAASLASLGSKFDGVIAVGDMPTLIASLTARALRVPFHSPEAVIACRNKFVAREEFRKAGLLVPDYFRTQLQAEPPEVSRSACYPCVLKPLGLSGSRGVIRANDDVEFCAAMERIRAILELPEIRSKREEHDRFIQVEAYIPGNEYALEGLVTGGRLQTLAIFDKPDPLEGPFFEETIYVTPSRAAKSLQEQLAATTQDGIRALGLSDGPIHAEMRHNEEGTWLLEIAARPIGGLCANALRFDGDRSLEEVILRHAMRQDVREMRREKCASGVMMIPVPESGIYRGIDGVESAAQFVDDVIITAQAGQRLQQLPEGASYPGFLFARRDTPEKVELALRRALEELRFDIASELPLMR